MGPLLCMGPLSYTTAPGGVIIRHGLLLAVYAELVKGHTHIVAYVHCKQCENCNNNCKKQIVKW